MADSPGARHEYMVVARRYRPQGFTDLVGQGMVSKALKNAIQSDRVGHAYLFTGARGVGKTSTARILSKALNCVRGPTDSPCHECDPCQRIAAGEDVDVLEIDGASNRGIDEIRQLRANVTVRPSRSRFKIYIIDEVHMLTKEAFNALLKTLEEPPEHVKFIFCTTDPEKIPITVLSRCQRFDFAPVQTPEIIERLKYIVDAEGAQADPEALTLLARRAAGSMRDSQSLLEQLLSYTSERITAESVHRMLGTANSARLHGVVRALADRQAAASLKELDLAVAEGVDAGQLAEQLLGTLRDLLALSVGGGSELMMHTADAEVPEMTEIARRWGTPNLLASAQILDQAIGRMRLVTHVRILLETALIRIAQLDNLLELSDLIAQLQAGVFPEGSSASSAPTPSKSTPAPVPSTAPVPTTSGATSPHIKSSSGSEKKKRLVLEVDKPAPSPMVHEESLLSPHVERMGEAVEERLSRDGTRGSEASAEELWAQTIAQLGEGLMSDHASHAISVANFAPNRLVVTFPAMYTSSKTFCQRPERLMELEKILVREAGRKLKVEFVVREDPAQPDVPKPAMVSARERERQLTQHPLVQRAAEIFSATITGVVPPRS